MIQAIFPLLKYSKDCCDKDTSDLKNDTWNKAGFANNASCCLAATILAFLWPMGPQKYEQKFFFKLLHTLIQALILFKFFKGDNLYPELAL